MMMNDEEEDGWLLLQMMHFDLEVPNVSCKYTKPLIIYVIYIPIGSMYGILTVPAFG